MHMAFDIKSAFFDVAVSDMPSTRDGLLDWGLRDRLGVVVDRPFGALDASLMIMLAATAFYDAGRKRRMRPLYPDMYLFHAGGPWGAHSAFDFAPDHKEIHVAPTAQDLLRAINHVGITHLLLPDRPPETTRHRYKEPEAAIDRIKAVFAYGPIFSGQPDVAITASPFGPLAGTFESTLTPEPYLEMMETIGASPEMRATDRDELAILIPMLRARQHEVATNDPERRRHLDRLSAARHKNRLVEQYRRIDVTNALDCLPQT